MVCKSLGLFGVSSIYFLNLVIITSIDLSLFRSIKLAISSLLKILPGEFIIFSKISFSVLFIFSLWSSLKIKSFFRSIFILPNSITLFISNDLVLFKILFILKINSFGSKGFVK